MYLRVTDSPVVLIPNPPPGGPAPASSAAAAGVAGLGAFWRSGVGLIARPVARPVPVRRPITSVPPSTPAGGGSRLPVPVATTPAASSNPPATQAAPSFAIVDVTTGSTSTFNPGDSWQVTISGAQPSAAIVVQTQVNGVPQPATSFGVTDATGGAKVTGTIPQSAGQWWEQWLVGGQVIATISFNVPGTTVATSPSVDSGAASSSSILDSLSTPVSIFGFSVPVWGLAAAGVGALMLFKGGKKGRRR
jgi:hypothetical protein